MADKNFIVKNGLEVGGQEVVSSSGVVTSAALGGQTLASTDSPTFNNLTLTNDIAVGGDLNLTGDLNITGDVNSLSVTDLDVTDQTITLGVGQVASASGGSGIVVERTDDTNPSILWDETNTEFDINNSINVTGTVVADGLTVDGTGTFNNNVGVVVSALTPSIRITETDRTDQNTQLIQASGTFRIRTASDDYNTTTERMRISNTNGDISFYDDTGTSQALFWDASAETLAIGHTSPSSTYRLDVAGAIRSFGNAPSYTLREDDASSQTWLMASYGGNFAVRDTTVSGTTYPFQIEAAAPTATLYLDSSGSVGIGTNNPDYKLEVVGNSLIGDATAVTSPSFSAQQQIVKSFTHGSTGIGRGGNLYLLNTNTTGEAGFLAFGAYYNNTNNLYYQTSGIGGGKETSTGDGAWGGYLNFWTTSDGTAGAASGQFEHMRITADGNVGIGDSSPAAKLEISGSKYVLTDSGRALGGIHLRPDSSSALGEYGGAISFSCGGAGSSAIAAINEGGGDPDSNGLAFMTHASSTGGVDAIEVMRIDQLGNLLVGKTDSNFGVEGCQMAQDGTFNTTVDKANNSGENAVFNRETGYGTHISFRFNNNQKGSISTNGSNVAYNTSSDYRLKENVDYDFNALDRVAQLKPARFNFISNPDITVDGFLAHEVQDIVPEATHGTKDEVDEEGNPVYQGIDQSKLVPLLTKAIQEQQTIIENLQSRLDEAGL